MTTIAAAVGVTAKTVRKWRDRYAAEGQPGLVDRSSRPHHSPARLDAADEDVIEALRRQRLSSPAIARRLGRPISTIGQVLRRRSLGRLSTLDPKPLIEDLADYAQTKLEHGGRAVPADRLSDPGLGLPATALAVFNASSVDRVTEWHRELMARKWQRAPRRTMLLKLHRERLEILKAHPLPSLAQCEPGPPRGIWPPAPPLEIEPEAKAAAGRKLTSGLAVKR